MKSIETLPSMKRTRSDMNMNAPFSTAMTCRFSG